MQDAKFLDEQDTPQQLQPSVCFHCFEAVPEGLDLTVAIDGAEQPMCCYGCKSVAETIVDQGLTHFYKYRDTSKTDVKLIPDELSHINEQLKRYDDPDIQREFVRSDDHQQSATLAIEGMTCAACAWLIEKQLHHTAGVQKVVVNSATERVQVVWDQRHTQLSQILSAIYAVGYKALPFQQADIEASYDRKRRGFIRRLGVAGIASMQTMMVAFGLYYEDIDATTKLYFWWVSLLFTAPVIVYSCQPFFANAIRALKARTLNMDVPVALAMAVMFIASFYATITDTGEVYYECVTMFAFFLLSGRFLELQARHKAIANAANLMKLIPAIAERAQSDDQWEQVMVKYLEAGDTIRVLPGDTIPVDGTLLSEQAWCDESLLTGESRPVVKRQNESLYAGSVNQEQAILLQVSATRQDTLLSSIIHMQDSAMEQKPSFVRIADVVSRYFIAAMLLVTALTYGVWWFIDPDRAFWVTLAVLVATCPCALSLAAPTAMSGAVSRLNRVGILLKQAALIERLPSMKTICVDKTGTLTQGRFSLVNEWILSDRYTDNEVHRLAASLEQASEHPLSRPFKQRAAVLPYVTTENHPGAGICGRYHKTNYRIGSLEFVQTLAPQAESPDPHANVFLADAEGLIAAWQVDDQARPDAEETIAWCTAQGYDVVMLTGDSSERAHAMAETLGITKVFAELKPADKLWHLQALQVKGPVLMIGDGINDGPVLAAADGSITFASGSDLAQAGSDVVILTGDLSALRRLQETAQLTRRIIRQNFAWALGYNLTILPLAVTGQVGPLLAMLGMSMSSLIVMANSLRLMRDVR
ncbi:cadmium-translocating P-type ATPase [Aliidiomarina halalkaliphila]|uniref:Cadmium-translocating P-type ATPase n=1 Tax=Aliidiomarina halalkaliphila TaxID=2593535 RepID=A0A552X402_9GAMM|nr:heavy metal translocating P-type ATPase [Aliidiomarina halalkaliphila]TRW49758.1 cadmium-translocating P-type ATPase [Aliidiomarina halalkaliphila]